jgi:hypothetical protein
MRLSSTSAYSFRLKTNVKVTLTYRTVMSADTYFGTPISDTKTVKIV